MNIFLCGFMGCGKTTAGKILSNRTNYRFVDLDEFISQKESLSISDIFEKYSEKYFRQLETKAIKELIKEKDIIVSLGGGAILNPTNAKIIKGSGKVVFIDIDEKTAFKRLENDTSRPLLNTEDKFETIKKLLNERKPIYLKYSDFTVNGAETPEKTAEDIINFFKI